MTSGVIGMQRKEVVGDALCVGGCAEDFFPDSAQRLDPRRDVSGAIGELAVAYSQLRANQATMESAVRAHRYFAATEIVSGDKQDQRERLARFG
jgi:hypothetical protein